LGAKLRSYHLFDNVTPSDDIAQYPVKGSNEIESVIYKDKKVWINNQQYFDKVEPEIWNFYIGGYQPAQKWLKDRKGQVLGYDEIQHYKKIANVLYLTTDMQGKIDGVYN
jgi:hypothetical protein